MTLSRYKMLSARHSLQALIPFSYQGAGIRFTMRNYAISLQVANDKSTHHYVNKRHKLKCQPLISGDYSKVALLPLRSYNTLLKREIKAWQQCFIRSGLLSQPSIHKLGGGTGHPTKEFCRYFKSSSSYHNDQPRHDQDDKDKDKRERREKEIISLAVQCAILSAIILMLSTIRDPNMGGIVINWKEFTELLAAGEVSEVIVTIDGDMKKRSNLPDYVNQTVTVKLHEGAVSKKGQLLNRQILLLRIPANENFVNRLEHTEAAMGIKPGQGVPVSYRNIESGTQLTTIVLALIFTGLIMRAMMKMRGGGSSFDLFGGLTTAKYRRGDTIATGKKGVSFKEVAGLHEAKVELMEFVDYLKNPQRYTKLGARIPKGALLTGPPGCGKTLLAKAVAHEAKVPFLVMAGSEFVEMIGGLGASRVRDLFKSARAQAPCIIYIDEIDAIGKKRSGESNFSGSMEGDHTLNQLLTELDGMDTTEGVIMLSSTNREEVLDKALLRAGRFDRHINIDLPTQLERKETFELYLKKMKIMKPATEYSDRLSQLTPGMSGADIRNICNEAALCAARNQRHAIDTEDFDYAMERVIAGVVKKSRVMSPREKRVIAYHEAGHALVGWLLEHTDSLLKVSIVSRTNATMGFAQYTSSDKKWQTKDELFEKLCLGLGGRVAESLIFNSVTTGAQDDLKKVTKMAYAQIKTLGMSEAIGHLSFPTDESSDFGKKPYSKRMAKMIDMEAQVLVAKAYQTTEKLLGDNKDKLQLIAEALLKKDMLNYDDVEALIGPPPFEKKRISTSW